MAQAASHPFDELSFQDPDSSQHTARESPLFYQVVDDNATFPLHFSRSTSFVSKLGNTVMSLKTTDGRDMAAAAPARSSSVWWTRRQRRRLHSSPFFFSRHHSQFRQDEMGPAPSEPYILNGIKPRLSPLSLPDDSSFFHSLEQRTVKVCERLH